MPKDDRKPNPKVSPFEKSETMEVCLSCGTLNPFGSRCPVCEVTHEEYKDRFTKFKRSE